jgi:hypothetical protein
MQAFQDTKLICFSYLNTLEFALREPQYIFFKYREFMKISIWVFSGSTTRTDKWFLVLSPVRYGLSSGGSNLVVFWLVEKKGRFIIVIFSKLFMTSHVAFLKAQNKNYWATSFVETPSLIGIGSKKEVKRKTNFKMVYLLILSDRIFKRK